MQKNQYSQLFSVLLMFLLIVGGILFVFPLRENVEVLGLERDAAMASLVSIQTEHDAMALLSDEVSKSAGAKQTLLTAVPANLGQDRLILELADIAVKAGFDLNAMNFSASVDQTYGNKLVVATNFAGQADDLIDFLKALENADRLLQVKTLNVQLTSSSDIAFNLNIEAYYQ
ncbi:type 4a pilus biogenesis protein PilO [Candidatus Peregrinibacteria bacterium]|jgi:Tfp pilus assembly protein PilO|nr:type 4a pilus biogenesis protein PilO [Candidatus Peregrinibacteria bacterium]MBT4632020.1 type 4a pilus biogenesis protein PilO [Candidatus Peregrinibacteria bacterium]MBT5824400.1 type 4a pilus biogenesis protein PilO [Candidatus Peregrinibacteria bacterium]